jgi:hypothetical protein
MALFNAATEADATRAYVTQVQTQANAAIARLTDSATKWTYSALSAVTNLTLADLPTADGTKPVTLTLSLPAYTPAVFTGLVTPNLPQAPTSTGATTPMWSETFWTNLKSKLSLFTDSITGSDDIDAAINRLSSETDRMQSALYAKDYERKTQTLRDLYSAAEAGTGAAGFTHPNCMTTALKMVAQQTHQFDLSEVSRTLIAGIFDWAKSNYQFSIQQSIAAHGADIDFNIRYLNTLAEVYSTTVTALLDKYRTDVQAMVAQAELRIKEYAAQYENELTKQKTLYDIRLKEATFDLEVDKANAAIKGEEQKLEIEDFKARVANFLETAKQNLEDRDLNIKNQIQASSAAANAALALAAGASTITLNTGGA